MRSRKRQKTEHSSSDEDDTQEEWNGLNASNEESTQSYGADLDDEVDAGSDEVEMESDDLSGSASVELEESETDEDDDDMDIPRTNGHTNGVKPAQAKVTTETRPQPRTISKPAKKISLANQIEEFLDTRRPQRATRETEADEVLHKIKKTIESIPKQGPVLVSAAKKELAKKKIIIPFPEPRPAEDSNLKYEYAKPTCINVVGSYPMKTADRSREFLYVDMVVEMPAEIFQPKDYLNHRYFHKRAYYLACIAAGLQASHANDFQLQFQLHHDDPLRPVIVIRPIGSEISKKKRQQSKWQINMLPAISEDQFPAEKLALSKLCLRSAGSEQISEPTPSYNSSLRADMLVTAYLKVLHQASTTCAAYKDACSLGSAWLKQRGFRATSRKGGFASFEWSALTALLLTSGGASGRPFLNQRYSSSQLFKATLQLLASRDLIKQPLSLGGAGDASQIRISNSPIVWDGVRQHNILYKMSSWSYRKMQIEAKTTLAMLDDQTFDGFTACFAVKKDHALLENDSTILLKEQDFDDAEPFLKLYQDLKQGLGDRARQINITADRSKPWNVSSTRQRINSGDISIGFTVDSEHVNRAVDHGPSAEDKSAAAAFRSFWGEKAELRRFKDGSISEALIWNGTDKKTSVFEQVLRYILRQRFGAKVESNAVFAGDAFARMLGSHSLPPNYQNVGEAFRKLENDIRSLDTPLPIRQILPAGLYTKWSHAQRSVGSLTRPLPVVLQFESSGRWPDDLAAIQRTKIAFLLRIKELFDAAVDSAQSIVGLEHEDEDILNQGFLDFAYKDGSAYRLRIYHDRETTLLERTLKNKDLDARTLETAAKALAYYKREYLIRPAHAQAMAQFCSRHPALTGTTMMLKKWIASHLLDNHIPDALIELIAAHTFVRPWPWQISASVQTGFLKTISWLASWDWRYDPLFVDFREKTDGRSSERTTMQTRFDAWRKLDPAMNRVTIFAASNVDTDGTTFTLDRPSKVAAGRITSLARAALSAVQTQGMNLQASSLFSSAFTDYDFVIHLDEVLLNGGKQSGSKYKNMQIDKLSNIADIGFAPAAEFLAELETVYGAAVMFYSGLPERAAIGGLWTPQTVDRPWRLNLAYSTLPVQTDSSVQAKINKTAIIAEISRLGGDLVMKIDFKQ